MLCSDESASEHSEHSPVHSVRLVLSDTAKLPVSSSDTCEWDPNYQISDSMLAQSGSQEEGEHDGNKENDPGTQAIVLDENRFAYSLLNFILCSTSKRKISMNASSMRKEPCMRYTL